MCALNYELTGRTYVVSAVHNRRAQLLKNQKTQPAGKLPCVNDGVEVMFCIDCIIEYYVSKLNTPNACFFKVIDLLFYETEWITPDNRKS